MADDRAVLARGLTKRYGDVLAVDALDLEIARGECFGLLGHHGAGKSTTIRMLTGRTAPTDGSAAVLGHDVVADRAGLRPRINVVFDEQNLHPRFDGRRTLRFWAQLYGASLDRVDPLLQRVGLDPERTTPVKDWSSGMRQRLLIARALINEPEVLFLDEPTRGLDPSSARALRGIIAELAAGGTTIFLTTHDMAEADALCDRIGFIVNGRIVALDTPSALKLAGAGETEVEVTTTDGERHHLRLGDASAADQLATWTRDGCIRTIHSLEPTLADVFVQVAGRPLDEGIVE